MTWEEWEDHPLLKRQREIYQQAKEALRFTPEQEGELTWIDRQLAKEARRVAARRRREQRRREKRRRLGREWGT